MAVLNLANFKGRFPAVDDAVLDDSAATVATDCRIQGGKLKPLKDPLQVQAKTLGSTLKSIYYYRPGDDWLEWATDVDAVPGQIGADAYDRVIFTGDGAPKITWNSVITTGGTPYPGISYLLGVPPPGYNVTTAADGTAPDVSLAGTPAVLGDEWYSGVVVPPSGTGDPGDYYVNEATSLWYEKNTDDTTWAERGNFGAPTPGAGNDINFVFQRAASEPTAPTGNDVPSGWSDTPPAADGNPCWTAYAEQVIATGVTVGSWSSVIQLAGSEDVDTTETRYYVATTVDDLGAEGEPTPVSAVVEWHHGQTVDVTIPGKPDGAYGLSPGTANLYRTATGTSGTEYLLVATGLAWGSTYSDAVAGTDLGEVLPTEDYDLPSASMIGITAMAGGFLAGHFDNVLCFSPPAAPHAWPVAYQLNTKTDIVGIKPLDDNTLLVTTQDRPYVAVGVDPANMVLTELPIMQACTSKRSVADVGIGVVYASPDGLVLMSKEGSRLLTESIFTREQWQALGPTTVEGWMWEGLYICFHQLPANGGFVINPAAPEAGIVDLSDYFTGAYHDPLADALYLTDGSNIKQWDAGTTYMNFVWKSKVFEATAPAAVSAAQLLTDGDDYFDLKVYAGGALEGTYTAADGAPFRLAGGYKTRKLQFSLQSRADGTGDSLHGVRIGETMKDLR